MRTINWFDNAPKGAGWLHKSGLKTGELVLVEGHTYRYSVENQGLDHVLTPAEPLSAGCHVHFGKSKAQASK